METKNGYIFFNCEETKDINIDNEISGYFFYLGKKIYLKGKILRAKNGKLYMKIFENQIKKQ